MKIQAIVQPNSKGQIVIPKAVRKLLGIDSETQLHLTASGQSFVVTPFVTADFPKVLTKVTYADILSSTKGTWADDSWPETASAREQTELVATKQAKKQW